jgi:plastocyanin
MRRLAIGLATALTLSVVMAAPTVAQGAKTTVEVRGGDILSPGNFIKNTFRFRPMDIAVGHDSSVTWVDRDRSADAPHTVTIVNKADLPQTPAQLDACFAPGHICAQTIEAHDPGSDQKPPFNFVVNRGAPGLDARGDSLLFAGPFNEAVTATVTASAGTTLSYLCVIHPWMQGSIKVR